MTIEDLLRRDLDAMTHDVPVGLGLDDVLSSGRSKRRLRHVAVGSGVAVAVMGIAGAAVLSAGLGTEENLVQPSKAVHRHVAAPPATPQDFVPGTDIDETMQTVIESHLDAGLDAAVTDVYPTDFTHDGAIPDDKWPTAPMWVAEYSLGSGQRLQVVMSYPQDDSWAGGSSQDVFGGDGVYAEVTSRTDWQNGFTVGDRLTVNADSQAQAEQMFAMTSAQLQAIVDDDALTFADPR